MKPTRLSRIVYWAILPSAVLLAINIVHIEVTRPRGPFCCGAERMDLLGDALNYALANLFQGFLIFFLGVIGALLWIAERTSRGAVSSPALPWVLIAIYGVAAACAILMASRPLPDQALMILGLIIIVLTWAGIALAIDLLHSARRFTPPPGD